MSKGKKENEVRGRRRGRVQSRHLGVRCLILTSLLLMPTLLRTCNFLRSPIHFHIADCFLERSLPHKPPLVFGQLSDPTSGCDLM